METYYFTFGQGHSHFINGVALDKDTVLAVEAPTHAEARDRVFNSEIGAQFATSYTADQIEWHYFPGGIRIIEGLSNV